VAVLALPSIAVIVPAFNEEARILPTLQRMVEYLASSGRAWSVTVVSDGSTDDTEDVVRRVSRSEPRVSLVAYSPNRGKGHAVRTGVMAAEGDLILVSDADLATPIEELEKLEGALEGRDIAIGSRPLRESRLEVRQPWHREMLGRAFNLLVQALAVRGIHDTQCGFKLFRRDAAKDVFARCSLDGFGFDFEALMIARDLGYRIAEVPVRWRHQAGSKVVLMRDGPRMIAELVMLRMRGKRKRLAARAH
jgi:dolichyl-phosphate beta-glucosyltransferase